MAELNPLDDTLPTELNALKARIAALERARQPYQGDWFVLSTSQINDGGTNTALYSQCKITFSTSTFDVSILSVSQRVRWKQTGDGSYKYGTIINVDTAGNYIDVFGNQLSSTTNPYTEFAYSPIVFPVGFPAFFTLTSHTFTPSTNPPTVSSYGVREHRVSIVGNAIYVDGLMNVILAGGPVVGFKQGKIDLPVFLTGKVEFGQGKEVVRVNLGGTGDNAEIFYVTAEQNYFYIQSLVTDFNTTGGSNFLYYRFVYFLKPY